MNRFLWGIGLLVVVVLGWMALKPATAPQQANQAHPDPRRLVRVATEGAYPPFNATNEKGELVGFDVDVTKAMCEAANFRCVFVAQDWDGLIPGLLTRKYDVVAASMSITDERKQAVDFTNRYYRTPIRFITRRDSTLLIDPEALAGKKIGVQRATTSAGYLQRAFGDQIEVRYYDTQENAYLDLTAGRVDALLVDAIQAWKWLKSPEGQNFDFRGETIHVDDGIGLALRKSDNDLRDAFNAALEKIRADGTYQAISSRYFPFDIY